MLALYHSCYKPELLKKLLYSEEWPKAVDDELLVPIDAKQQARHILEMLVGTQRLGKTESFLDYGCGVGETTRVAPEYGVKKAIGYDIQPAAGVTTKLSEVRASGPYDVILVHDVLDHLVKEGIFETMAKIKTLLKPNGRVFVRCHPYISRAGTHLPSHNLNKAYAHLFFPELEGEHVNKIIHPMKVYRDCFWAHKLDIEDELVARQKIDNFFYGNKDLWYLIQKITKTNNFLWQLAINHADFILKHTEPRTS